MKRLKGAFVAIALAAGITAMTVGCSAGSVDAGVSCTEKTAKPLVLECTVSKELTSDQFGQMLASAQDSLSRNSSVQKTADELEDRIAAAGMKVEVVTKQLPKGSTMRGSYDDGFVVMGNGMVASDTNASNSPKITLYTGNQMQTLEMLGGNRKAPMSNAQKLAHERVHVLQASKKLLELTQLLSESGFIPTFLYNWGGSSNSFYLNRPNLGMSILDKPKAGKTYGDKLREDEKIWASWNNTDFINSFYKLLDSYSEKRLGGKAKAGDNSRAKALEALTLEGDGIAKAFDAAHLIGEAQAYIAIPHSAVYRKSDIEDILKGYINTKIEEQLFPQVSSALDHVMRGYVALENAGITGTDAHVVMTRIAGNVMRPAQDYAQPFTFLKEDISALVQQLGVPEPTDAEVSAGWEKLGERNKQVTFGEIGDAVIGAAKDAIGANGRIAAVAGKRKILGVIPVTYCKSPEFSGTSLLDVKATATEANGIYTASISGTVKC